MLAHATELLCSRVSNRRESRCTKCTEDKGVALVRMNSGRLVVGDPVQSFRAWCLDLLCRMYGTPSHLARHQDSAIAPRPRGQSNPMLTRSVSGRPFVQIRTRVSAFGTALSRILSRRTVSTTTLLLGVFIFPSKSKLPRALIPPGAPMITSVSPSQSGRQLTATQDAVDHTADFPSMFGTSRMLASLMNNREFNAAILAELTIIGAILGSLSNHPAVDCKSNTGDTSVATYSGGSVR